VRVLLAGLPPDSALARAHTGHAWTTDVPWLLANINDGVNVLGTLTHNANVPKGKQVKAPERVPRPDTGQDGEQSEHSEDELAAIRAEMDQTRRRIFSRR